MKRLSTILGVLAILLTFNGCNSNDGSNQDVTDTSNIDMNNSIVNSNDYISDEYSELFHTWYSATDIIAFTDDGEFYLTYDDINYCISGTYSIENDIINIVIDESTIKNNLMKVTDTSYKFQFVDGNLILTLADDESQSVTYYLDKSVALGQSN